jgi:hypothetical protein
MTYIPRLMCDDCGQEFKCIENGTMAEVLIDNGQRPYYKIATDRWTCKGCGSSVLIPAHFPTVMRHDPDYEASFPDARPIRIK